MEKYFVLIGRLIIFDGIMIVLAILLPAGAWWFIGGIALIVIGVNCCRYCKRR